MQKLQVFVRVRPCLKQEKVAGLSSAGKSFMALQIAANAQKKGMYVVYFDAESALSNDFMIKAVRSKITENIPSGRFREA